MFFRAVLAEVILNVTQVETDWVELHLSGMKKNKLESFIFLPVSTLILLLFYFPSLFIFSFLFKNYTICINEQRKR